MARMNWDDMVRGRLETAKVNGGAGAVEPRGGDRFTVVGRAGDRYTVHAISLEMLYCDCKAGRFGRPCWHAAATYLRLIGDGALLADES